MEAVEDTWSCEHINCKSIAWIVFQTWADRPKNEAAPHSNSKKKSGLGF